MILKKLLSDSIPFSERERKLLMKLIEIYVRENGKYGSFVYCLGTKKPEECDGVLDLSNLKFKWIFNDAEHVGLMGAWNMLTPDTIYITCHSIGSVDNYDGRYGNIVNDMRHLDRPGQDTAHCMVLNALITQFPIIMHELYHMLQFKACMVGYIAMRLVTVFTKLPYYLSQAKWMEWCCPDGENTSWVQTWNKFTIWDLEGQAELYGDKAPGMKEFVKHINIVAPWEFYMNNYNNRQRALAAGKEPSYSEESLETFKACTIQDYGGQKYWDYAIELHQWCKK